MADFFLSNLKSTLTKVSDTCQVQSKISYPPPSKEKFVCLTYCLYLSSPKYFSSHCNIKLLIQSLP